MTAPLEIAVLVSVGHHPASGRARRADLDARALEMALGLGAAARAHVVHAGDPNEPALRDYLGMGIETLTVLALPAGADPLPALAAYLRARRFDLILCGAVAEAGLCSGQLPYALAARLGGNVVAQPSKEVREGALDYGLAPGIVAIEPSGNTVRMVQALPRGQRRALEASLPLIATVDRAAPPARASAFGPARRGRIVIQSAEAVEDVVLARWREQPARRRPKRLRVASGSAAERLKAATEMQTGRGRLMANPDPEDAAQAIWDYLISESIIRPG